MMSRTADSLLTTHWPSAFRDVTEHQRRTPVTITPTPKKNSTSETSLPILPALKHHALACRLPYRRPPSPGIPVSRACLKRQRRIQLGIGGELNSPARVVERAAQLGGGDQIAVVGQGEGPSRVHQHHGLGIADLALFGGGYGCGRSPRSPGMRSSTS